MPVGPVGLSTLSDGSVLGLAGAAWAAPATSNSELTIHSGAQGVRGGVLHVDRLEEHILERSWNEVVPSNGFTYFGQVVRIG